MTIPETACCVPGSARFPSTQISSLRGPCGSSRGRKPPLLPPWPVPLLPELTWSAPTCKVQSPPGFWVSLGVLRVPRVELQFPECRLQFGTHFLPSC